MKTEESYRTAWRRDFARLIHCPSFRRLQGKTQVFPGNESDFYRNRLTHSLEVAQIAKSIAIRLNATNPLFKLKRHKIEPDIVEFAGLAHDLGHPPFGHNGEEALDECMREYGGFEGNAQTLRIVSRLEKKAVRELIDGKYEPFDSAKNDLRCGLGLTYRSLASLLKYDAVIPERGSDRSKPGSVMKGYYAEDAELVRKIKDNVINPEYDAEFKTIECSIMDIADDIAYSTYDLEDNLKAGFLTPLGLFCLDEDIYSFVSETINGRLAKQYTDVDYKMTPEAVKEVLFKIFYENLFEITDDAKKFLASKDLDRSEKLAVVAAQTQRSSRTLASDGYERSQLTSRLVQNFLHGVEVQPHRAYPQLHRARLTLPTFLEVEVLKNITYHAIIRSPWLQVVEFRGKDIVKDIFKALNSEDGTRLLPEDFKALCRLSGSVTRMRTICDFIAGMTDRYAIEFYSRLYGANHLTIHKPM
ncbi:dGTP triphosphohydrolase [Prosthecodimorpha staleyi]